MYITLGILSIGTAAVGRPQTARARRDRRFLEGGEVLWQAVH
jgi:hypothetical protein